MRGFLSLVFLVALVITAFIVPEKYHHCMATAGDFRKSGSESQTNTTDAAAYGCVGLHCLVADDIAEANLFMDQQQQGMLAANFHKQVTRRQLSRGKVVNCPPKNLYGASSCLNSNQINKARPCVSSNREYPYCLHAKA